MTAAPTDRIRDHWYWRPGWTVGRRFYTWHITFAGQPDVVAMSNTYRAALEGLPTVDPIPPQWLHLTMQGLGFIDEIEVADVERIVAAARLRCAQLEPLKLTLGAPHVDPESIQIAIQPADAVRQLRLAIRAAIADIWGSDNVPEPAEPFNPHMSLGYTNADADAAPLQQALTRVSTGPVRADIDNCQLIILHRDHRMYEWTNYATVDLDNRRS